MSGKEMQLCSNEAIRLLEPDEVASILRCRTKDVQELVRKREISCVQISERKRLFTLPQVQEYIDSKTIERRIDRKSPRPVSSRPKKGGAKELTQKSLEVQGSGSLVEEIRELCQ